MKNEVEIIEKSFQTAKEVDEWMRKKRAEGYSFRDSVIEPTGCGKVLLRAEIRKREW